MNAFIINESINSRVDLSLRITMPPVIPVSKRIIESIDIDGREGMLTVLKGWEDMTFNMTVAITGRNIQTRWLTVLPPLLAAKTVCFSNTPNIYYRVKYVEVGELGMTLTTLGEFSLTFTCEPFRYMRNVETITFTSAGVVTNPGTVYSLPRIKIYGTGLQTLTINGKNVVLDILSGNLTLDSSLKDCYFNNVAMNNRMTGDFPILNVGLNTVAFGSGITKVEIEPMWRYI